MKPLKIFAIGAEVTVISTLAISSYHLAFSSPPSSLSEWMYVAPLVTVGALEMLRLPVAFNIWRSGLLGKLLSTAMICGLSVITMEAASMAFESLIDQRVKMVNDAEDNLSKIMVGQKTIDKNAKDRTDKIERLTAAWTAAQKHREDIDKPIQLQDVAPDKTCWRVVTVKGKRPYRVAYDCTPPEQKEERMGNTDAQEKHTAELKDASEQEAKAKAALDAEEANAPDTHVTDEARDEAQRKVDEARATNPMYQLAATWMKVPVQDLTKDQFELVKHWAVIALAGATAFTTALAAFISTLPEGGSGKLARALRARLAAKRKTLRRINERVVTEIKQQTKVIYVPVDVASGKVLDPAFAPAPSTPDLKVVR
jgi:hypothetical protein